MTTETIHTCSYECDRPECIRAQRDELAARLTAETSAPVGVEGLVRLLERIRDLLSSLPVDCLGSGTDASGQPYPIRDEVIHGITKALAQQPAAVDGMAELVGLLDEVRSHFTRDDDLPDDLLPRIDAALATQHREPTT